MDILFLLLAEVALAFSSTLAAFAVEAAGVDAALTADLVGVSVFAMMVIVGY